MDSSILLPLDPVSQHRWLLRVQPDCPDRSLKAVTSLLRGFAYLGNSGAFVASDSDGTNCFMRISLESPRQGNLVEFLVDVGYCDVRYTRILRNIVFAMGEITESPILEFRVSPATRSHREEQLNAEVDQTEVEARRFYPEISPRLGVQLVSTAPADPRSGRRISIRFAGELSLELVKDMTELVDRWASVLAEGYPNSEKELQDGESLILNVDGSQHDEITFEVLVDRFIASEAAFSSLVNMLIIRVRRDSRVSMVALE